MKIVLQRVSSAGVSVDGQLVAEIKQGYLLLVCVMAEDETQDILKVAEKIAKLRIFEDDDEKMNCSLSDVAGEILSISQFTLAGEVRKGNRPSFTQARRPEEASALFDLFNSTLRSAGFPVKTGVFGAHMEVSLVNDGPVTLVIESKRR